MSVKLTAVLAAGAVAGSVVLPAAPASSYAVGPTCHGRTPTIVGTPGDDQLEGTEGRDVILTGDGADHVLGNGGRDLICLGAGNDFAEGGQGNDRIRAGAGDDYLADTVGYDQLTGNRGRDVLFITSASGVRADGGRGSDAISLTVRPGTRVDLTGGPGWDQIGFGVAGEGRDVTIDQEAGTFEVLGSTGTFSGFSYVSLTGEHRWSYFGTDRADRVSTVDGEVTAVLRGGKDRAWTGDGDDWIDGGDGHDFASPGGGTNHCISVEDTDGFDCPAP